MKIKDAIKNWFINWRNFSGTATRKEFWVGFIFSVLLFFVVFLFILAGLAGIAKNYIGEAYAMIGYLILTFGYGIYFVIQTISASVRRFDDAKVSKWWASLIGVAFVSNLLTHTIGPITIYPVIACCLTLIILWSMPSKLKEVA